MSSEGLSILRAQIEFLQLMEDTMPQWLKWIQGSKTKRLYDLE